MTLKNSPKSRKKCNYLHDVDNLLYILLIFQLLHYVGSRKMLFSLHYVGDFFFKKKIVILHDVLGHFCVFPYIM